MELLIASAPDREKLVAEIWDDNKMIAEINQETSELRIEIYSSEGAVQVNYETFLNALIRAKAKLKGEPR